MKKLDPDRKGNILGLLLISLPILVPLLVILGELGFKLVLELAGAVFIGIGIAISVIYFGSDDFFY